MPDIKTDAKESSGKGAETVQYWMGEVDDALKREKDWRKNAREVTTLYEGDKKRDDGFNILYSNTETLAPALMNSSPRPRVRRRFLDKDPLGKVSAKLVERSLEFLLDSDMREFPEFEDLVESAILGGLVPGRGVTRFKYDATIEAVEGPEGPVEQLVSETVHGETVPWNRFLHGYARVWKNVPWVGFEWPMTMNELKKNFGDEVAARCKLVDIEQETDTKDDENSAVSSRDTSTKGAWVYEIWDKDTKKVLFVSSCYPDDVLKEVEDPLGLSGFFPCPEPLRFTRRLSSLLPTPPYTFYEEQAKELNRVTSRINKIVSALKNRGFYDSSIEGIDKVLSAPDNTLIPAENAAGLQQGQSLEKAIFLMPIEKLVTVLQQLYLQRNQVKQVIYEITGIADIMRGSTAASETLGAQQIKNQWGTLRLKYSQGRVRRYVRDSLRIIAEIAVTKLSPQTLLAMTGSELPTEEQKQQAQMAMEQFQQRAAMAAQQPQQPGQPPQQPPQPPQELVQLLQSPSIEGVLQLLQNDLLRSYRIDIETDSTIEQEVSQDKQDMAEMMNALGQFMNGIGPLVTAGIVPFEVAKALLMGIVRRFRFGGDVESLLENMQPPKPQEPEKKGEDPQVIAAKTQGDLAMEQARQATTKLEMEFRQQEHQMKLQELTMKMQVTAAQTDAKLRQIAADMQKTAQAAAIAKAAPKTAGITRK